MSIELQLLSTTFLKNPMCAQLEAQIGMDRCSRTIVSRNVGGNFEIHSAFCAPRKWIKLEARPRRGSARNWSAIDKERSRMKSSIVWPEIYIRLLIYVEIYLFYFYFTYFLKRSKRGNCNIYPSWRDTPFSSSSASPRRFNQFNFFEIFSF